MRHEKFMKDVRRNAGRAVKGQGESWGDVADQSAELQEKFEVALDDAAQAYARSLQEFSSREDLDEAHGFEGFLEDYMANHDVGQELLDWIGQYLRGY